MKESREIVILGRTLRWTQEGLEYEADGKHRKALMRGLGLEETSKTVSSPAIKAEEMESAEEEEAMGSEDARKFRSLAATLNYLGADRSDVQYAAKEICARMARPSRGSWRRLKKAGRYLVGMEKVVWEMKAWSDAEQVKIDVHVDSDWAKGPERKSTSGGMMMLGGTVVKYWSRTQATRALSVAEAEYCAVVRGAAEGLGAQSLLADLGMQAEVNIWTDSNGARAIAGRRGLGKTRHVELKYLWVQEMTNSGQVKMRRVPGTLNLADHLTKGKTWREVEQLVKKVGCRMEGSERAERSRGRTTP